MDQAREADNKNTALAATEDLSPLAIKNDLRQHELSSAQQQVVGQQGEITAGLGAQHHEAARHELNDLNALRALQAEIEGTPRQNSRESDQDDEAHLAAQLTQDLTQGLGPVPLEDIHSHRGPVHSMSDVRDGAGADARSEAHFAPNMSGQMAGQTMAQLDAQRSELNNNQVRLRDQIQAQLQHHQHHHEQQLQHMIPRDGQQGPQDATADAALLQSFPHGEPAQINPLLVPSASRSMFSEETIPPRRRTKISRACDECRRKKIKCDATAENGDESCSNCRRSHSICLFSRIPQKRGPSKGYIKELADRIHQIEGKLGSSDGSEVVVRRASADAYSPLPNVENNRKRPYASISGSETQELPIVHRTAAQWAAEHQPTHSVHRYSYSSVNDLAPKPTVPPGWLVANQGIAQPESSVLENVVPEDHQRERPQELDMALFQYYLEDIHPTLPILPRFKARADEILRQSPATLQDAFQVAFHAMVRSQTRGRPFVTPDDVSVADRLLKSWELSCPRRSKLTDLVRLQILLMLILDADSQAVHPTSAQSTLADLLWKAAGLGLSMKLHEVQPRPTASLELEPDSDDHVALRAWWTLVVLDRRHAIAWAGGLVIPNDAVVILPGLKLVLGEAGYNMIQLANILGHLVPISKRPSADLIPKAGLLVGPLVNLVLDGFRNNFPQQLFMEEHPLLHLAYWHARILATLFSASSRTDDLLRDCGKATGILVDLQNAQKPQLHHSTCLLVLVLQELSKVGSTRARATDLMMQLSTLKNAPPEWQGMIDGKIAEQHQAASVLNNKGLQQLADIAAQANASAAQDDGAAPADLAALVKTLDGYRGLGFNPVQLLQTGYLVPFVPDPA